MAWYSKVGTRNYFCHVSGGYIMFGHWEGDNALGSNFSNCNMETFLAGQFKEDILKVRLRWMSQLTARAVSRREGVQRVPR
jgi:hypothetical protein